MEGQCNSVFSKMYTSRNVPPSFSADTSSNAYSLSINPTSIISEETRKKHVNHMLRNSEIAAGVGVLLMTPLMLLAMNGKLPKPIHKTFNNLSKNIANKIEELRERPHISKIDRIYLNCFQKIAFIGNKVRGFVFNAGPLKDVLAEKTLNKIGLKKACAKITNFFEETAVKMTLSDYKKSGNAFNTMAETFENTNTHIAKLTNKSNTVTINGITKTIEEWGQEATEKLNNIRDIYKFFSKDAVKNRGRDLGNSFNGLGDDVFSRTYGKLKQFLTSPKQWTTFITEEIVAPKKTKFKTDIMTKKKKITNTRQDISKELTDALDSLKMNVNMSDEKSFKLYRKIKKLINEYQTNDKQSLSNIKNNIINKLNNIVKETDKVIVPDHFGYTPETNNQVKRILQNIQEIIQTNKKGDVENILDIYKAILPEKEFEAIRKIANKSKKALNTAVNTETDKYVDKMRDLKSGSAITDVGSSFLIPIVSTGIGMSMADTKEKKRSVLINLGIPLLVGVGTSIAGTIAMLTAGPSLILGVAATTITGKICKTIDNSLKQPSKENVKLC